MPYGELCINVPFVGDDTGHSALDVFDRTGNHWTTHSFLFVYRTGHYVQYDPESTKETMNLLKHGGVWSFKFDIN